MKKVLFLMLSMLLLTSINFGQSLKALDDKYGFRDV